MRNERKTINLSDIKKPYNIEKLQIHYKHSGKYLKIRTCLLGHSLTFCHHKSCQKSIEMFKKLFK